METKVICRCRFLLTNEVCNLRACGHRFADTTFGEPQYANDGWNKDTLRKPRESSQSSGSSPHAGQISSDTDHEVEVVDGGQAQDPDEDDTSIAPAGSLHSSDVRTPDEADEDTSLASDNDDGPRRLHRSRLFLSNSSGTAWTRGIQQPRDLNKSEIYPATFGHDADDLEDVRLVREIWLKARDITLPSQQTLTASFKLPKDADGTEVRPEDHSGLQGQNRLPLASHSNQLLTQVDKGRNGAQILDPKQAISFRSAWPRRKATETSSGLSLDLGLWQSMDEDASAVE